MKNWVAIYALQHKLKQERAGKNRSGEIKRLEYQLKLLGGKTK